MTPSHSDSSELARASGGRDAAVPAGPAALEAMDRLGVAQGRRCSPQEEHGNDMSHMALPTNIAPVRMAPQHAAGDAVIGDLLGV